MWPVTRQAMRTRLRTTFMALALALAVTALVLIQAVQTAWTSVTSGMSGT